MTVGAITVDPLAVQSGPAIVVYDGREYHAHLTVQRDGLVSWRLEVPDMELPLGPVDLAVRRGEFTYVGPALAVEMTFTSGEGSCATILTGGPMRWDSDAFVPPACPVCGARVDADWLDVTSLGWPAPVAMLGRLTCSTDKLHDVSAVRATLAEWLA